MIDLNGNVRQSITVKADPQRAFDAFTREMTAWWPPAHHIGSAPIQQIVVEPFVGGRWFTKHEDGTETSTGVVAEWDPPRRFVVTWQISSQWQYDVALRTEVQVDFVAEAPDVTRVDLAHIGLDGYGADAERMRETFDGPGAWVATLEAYAGHVAG